MNTWELLFQYISTYCHLPQVFSSLKNKSISAPAETLPSFTPLPLSEVTAILYLLGIIPLHVFIILCN